MAMFQQLNFRVCAQVAFTICPPSGDVGQARDFLMDAAFPQRARHGDDVLARVVRDEESGDGAEQLCGFGDGAEFKVRDLSGE